MTDLDELERLALEAAPGPWRATHTREHRVWAPGVCLAEVEAWADADYIAAASPDVILDLIARVRAAEERPATDDVPCFGWVDCARKGDPSARACLACIDRHAEVQTQKSPHQPEG